jgi:hypothetical protein
MSMPQNQRISDLLLEQYSLGELGADQQRLVAEELERDEVLRARLAALKESDREILAAYPAERIVPAIRERLLRSDGPSGGRTTAPRPRVNPLTRALPIAAMVVLLLSVFIIRERLVPSETRLKGLTPHLTIFRKTTLGAEELRAGSLVRRADVLQIGYIAGEAKYGVIFSVDGRGTLTWHLPGGYGGGARTAPSLDHEGQVVLPSAYELDDAPGFERFFLVYSTAPFEISDVAQAARALAARPSAVEREDLGLSRTLGQYSVLVKKQVR